MEANNVNGDIVVGNWNTEPGYQQIQGRVICPSTGMIEPFCPANGSTNLQINAIKTVARRTFDAPNPNVSIGYNPVRLFLGQVFRYLGTDASGQGRWQFMNAVAECDCVSDQTVGISSAIIICFHTVVTPPGPPTAVKIQVSCVLDPKGSGDRPCGDECRSWQFRLDKFNDRPAINRQMSLDEVISVGQGATRVVVRISSIQWIRGLFWYNGSP